MDIPHFHVSTHQLMDIFTVSILEIMNIAFMHICEQVFVWTYVFISLGYIPRSEIAELHGNYV
jgi:GTP cyclohydrolase I